MLKYESGMTLMEIVAEGDVSRRTAYRYLAYYKELQKIAGTSKVNTLTIKFKQVEFDGFKKKKG
jgi:stalled ribosome rescue protein Dom34